MTPVVIPQSVADRSDLTQSTKLVYGLLVACESDKRPWPSLRQIASAVGIGWATAKRAVNSLERAGLVCIDRRRKLIHRLLGNAYRLTAVVEQDESLNG